MRHTGLSASVELLVYYLHWKSYVKMSPVPILLSNTAADGGSATAAREGLNVVEQACWSSTTGEQ